MKVFIRELMGASEGEGQRIVSGYICALMAVCIWSGFILVSRVGGLSPLSSFDVIAIRYTVSAVLLVPFWFLCRFRIWQPRLIISSLTGALMYALFVFYGFEYTPASHSAVLLPGLMPLAITLLSVWLLGKQVLRVQWFGVFLITAGVLGLLWQTGPAADHQNGHVFIIMAALCWAVYSVLLNKWSITPWQATVSLSVITFWIYMPVYLLWLPRNIQAASFQDIALQAFYQGVLATIVQMLLYVRAVQLIGAPAMGSMMAMVPVIAGLASVYLFDEPLTDALLAVFLLVSAGVWLANQTRMPGSVRKIHKL